jgi:transketolase
MTNLDQLCVDTIRTLSIDAVQKANSGHPGLPMGAAPMAYVLWSRHLRHNPKNPHWHNRDRFVLSAGHGSMLIYSLLHLTGYDVSLDDVKNFRQWESNTPGHPESFMTLGVEATTGPLGQGTANAVGMAIAERRLAHLFNSPGFNLVDHYTYALVGDGDLMEGISAEAASLAGHLQLGKLIYLYDSNDISLDGPTDLTYTEDVAKRYESYGWQVLLVEDGDHDLDAIDAAIKAAKDESTRPSLIIVKTTIGFGSPKKAGSEAAHGAPLGDEEILATKKQLGWPSEEPFFLPEEAIAHFRTAVDRGQADEAAWQSRLEAFAKAQPEQFLDWQRGLDGQLPHNFDDAFPHFEAGKAMATRSVSGKIINYIANLSPLFFGGDADLSCSTKTAINDGGDFDGQTGEGRNIRYGVREHAMGAIANGIAYHGGLRSYTATFFCFADYMRPAMRLAALSKLPVTFVFTHDSIALGEDGPTHQPVEHLASLRSMPNMVTIRPADANETTEAWKAAMRHLDGPVSLVFTRQDVPTLDREVNADASGLAKGAYVLRDFGGDTPQLILMATGSEVALALEAGEQLAAEDVSVRVVSMPSWELFKAQDADYRESVLPPGIKARVAVEAGVTFGWDRWVGDRGIVIGIDSFGASAPGDENMRRFGFTVENVVAKAKTLI